jgi:hypothetical protein
MHSYVEGVMSKPRLIFFSAAMATLACGIIVALLMGISAIGTSVALPGLGIVVAGPLAGAFLGGLLGGAAGFILGLLVGIVIIVVRK